MIRVANLNGQLGNRLLRLINALQLSKKKEMDIKLQGRDDITRDIFENFNFSLGKYGKKTGDVKLNNLGERFYEYTYEDPKKLLAIKPQKRIRLNPYFTNIAIHLRFPPKKRGQDYPILRDEKVLEEYYIGSIKKCVESLKSGVKKPHFIIFGPITKNQFRKETSEDQLTAFITKFKFYKRMIQYLKENKISFEYSITIEDSKQHYMRDFLQMCECDIIISSYSTFSICAGFLGKEKKIIHSKKITEAYVKKKDKFWINLYKGGNKYYKLWYLI